MKMKLICLLAAFSLLLSGCTVIEEYLEEHERRRLGDAYVEPTEREEEQEGGEDIPETEVQQGPSVPETYPEDLFSDRDFRLDYEIDGTITLSGDSASADCRGVAIDGTMVTVVDEGIYAVQGSLTDGMIIVDVTKDQKVQLVLSGVEMTSTDCAPIYIRQADKVFITLAPGSENSLTNTEGFYEMDGNNIDSVIFSKDDLTLNGTGSLSIISYEGHGVVSKDELTITGGNYYISAAGQGLSGKDNICIAGGTFDIETDKAAIHAENEDDAALGFIYIQDGSFDLYCGGDGFHSSGDLTYAGGSCVISTYDDGFHSDSNLLITGGSIYVEESYEGLEGMTVEITGGEVTVYAEDDGINAAGGSDQSGFGGPHGGDRFSSSGDVYISVAGGELYICAEADVMDSNGDLEVSGGDIVLCGPSSGDTAILDYDRYGYVIGGNFFGSGASMMSSGFDSNSTQGTIMVELDTCDAGTEVILTDAAGNVIAKQTPELDFYQLIISSPEILEGETYTLTVDGESWDITMDSVIYGSAGSGGRGGGGRGHGRH